jgi:SNF2 family DNA or RNA helicase
MSQRFTPHPYQEDAAQFGLGQFLFGGPGAAAFLHDPGMGKTALTLSLIRSLKNMGVCGQTLLIAPLRPVYSVWPQELRKWSQFNGLTYRIVHGNEEKRIRALRSTADLLLINADGVHWLIRYLIGEGLKQVPLKKIVTTLRGMQLQPLATQLEITGDLTCVAKGIPPSRYKTLIKHTELKLPFGWHNLVIDESSLFKNPDSNRFQALRSIANQFRFRSLLTGTPCPNGLIDLWAQIYLLDGGEALGQNITAYRQRYFYQDAFGRRWLPVPGAEQQIHDRIAHLCHRLDEKDHLDLPPLVVNDIWVDLDAKTLQRYKQLEREFFVELEDESTDILVGSAAAKYGACRGFANGGIYEQRENQERLTHQLHEHKLAALQELIGELQERPLLVAYPFIHDLERIRKKYPKAPAINGSTSAVESDRLIEQWNRGELPLLLVHPQSLSHGVNMQANGNDICWFGLTDNLEHYLQLNKRLHRQGVRSTVRIHRILCRNTVDLAIRERINDKDQTQRALLDALLRYRKGELAA